MFTSDSWIGGWLEAGWEVVLVIKISAEEKGGDGKKELLREDSMRDIPEGNIQVICHRYLLLLL